MDEPNRTVRPRRGRGQGPMSPRQRGIILALGIVLAFVLGVLAGVGLSCYYGILGRQPAAQVSAGPSAVVTEPTVLPTTQEIPPTIPPTTQEPATAPATTPPTQPPTVPVTEPETEPPAAYLLPNSSSAYLSEEDFAAMSHWELILARNEIFARHGRRFQNADIQAYFDSCSWYSGTIAPEDFDSGVLNDMEIKNVQILKAASERN